MERDRLSGPVTLRASEEMAALQRSMLIGPAWQTGRKANDHCGSSA